MPGTFFRKLDHFFIFGGFVGAGSSNLGGSLVAVTRGNDEEVVEEVSDEHYTSDKDEAHDEIESMNNDESDF